MEGDLDEKKKEEEKPSKDKPKHGLPSCCIVGIIFGGLFIIAFIVMLIHFNSGGSKKVSTAQPTSSSQSSSTPSVSQEDLLNYFVEVTTYNGKMTKRLPVCRWTKNPINVEIKGDVNDKTILALDDAIKEFNAVSNTKMEKVSSGGDLLVYFMPVGQFPPNNLGESIKGVAYFDPDSSCVISSGKVYVDDTEFADSEQLTYHDALLVVTRHELLHALGFSGHDTKKRGCTALSSIACLTKTYTQYDISAIKMLYNSNLPLCSDETEIRKLFTNNVPD